MSGLYRKAGKRVMDLTLILVTFPLWFPLMFVTALLVRTRLGKPVLFRQSRPGYASVPFQLLKFRTMTNARGSNGSLLPDQERLTPFGRFLRGTSLDELPEILNVIKGDMSLVGPRPLLTEYLPRYTARQARRHEVRPGITGWAQINGRNSIEWAQKFEFDVWYVDNQTVALDLKILAGTVLKVVNRDGIAAQGHATMPEFLGNEGRQP